MRWMVIIASLVLAPQVRAADLETKVNRIFEAGEGKLVSAASRTSTHQKLTKLAPAAGDDYRVKYAYAVALTHEHHYPEALKAVGQAIKSQPEYLPARRTRTWLLLTLRKHQEALAELESMARLLPAEDQRDNEDLAALEAAQFMGTVVGYFEGPGNSLITAPVLAKYKTLILARMTSQHRAAFVQQCKAVADEFEKVRDRGEQAQAKEAEKKKQAVNVVQDKQAELSKARADVTERTEQTVQQLRDEWNKLSADLAAAQNAYKQAAARALLLQSQLAQARTFLLALGTPNTDDKGKISASARDAYNRQAPALLATINGLESQLLAVGVDMNQLVQRGATIESRMVQLSIEGGRLGENFVLQEHVFDKRTKSLAQQQNRLVNARGRTASISGQQRAFQTYEDFSYESEKQRVLESLASP